MRCFGALHSLDFRQVCDANHYTALWNAIRLRNNPMVACLCEVGVDLSDGGSAAVGESPLHMAVRLGEAGIAHTLIDAGADLLATDASGGTPCHSACRAGHDYLVELLYDVKVEGSHAEIADRIGRTPLDVGIAKKHLSCCAEIIRIRHNRRIHGEWMTRAENAVASLPKTKKECSTGGNGMVFVGNNGWSLLHASVVMGLIDMVKLTLDKSTNREAMLKARARDFQMTCTWTPMMLAVLGEDQGYKEEILKVLIAASEASWCGSAAGTSPLLDRNEENWDALWLASNEGHTTLVEILLEAGAEPSLCDNQGVNCLMAAALAGQVGSSQVLIDAMFGGHERADQDMLATLSTVLFCGLMASDTQLIETALSLGVDPNKLDPYGMTVAQHAVGVNCSDAVLRLLANKGHATLWVSPKFPGLPVVIYLDHQIDCLHASARHQQLSDFLNSLEMTMDGMTRGEPAWIVGITKSIQARNSIEAARRERERNVLGSPARASCTMKTGASGNVDIVLQQGKYVQTTEKLRIVDVVRQVVTARNDLERNAKAEVRALEAGKRCYKLSLHFHVTMDVIGAAHAFLKRPALLKQVCSQIDPLQRTPLHVAAQLGKTDWVRVLIETNGLTKGKQKRMIEAADIHGKTALHFAVENGSTEIVSLILKARPHLLEAETKVGRTPRELASSLRLNAQTILKASRYREWWSRRLVATVDDKTLLAMDKELALREAMETTLLQRGAADHQLRMLHGALRWCALVVGLPWFALTTLVSVVVLTVLSPTLREAAITLHNLRSHRPYAIGAVATFLIPLCGVTLFSVYADERLLSQLCVLGCIGFSLLFQLIVTSRILRSSEYRWQWLEPPARSTVALFHKGVDKRSVLWLALLAVELPQQAALAFVGADRVGLWWQIPLLSPAMFSCVDHENCEADLRNMTGLERTEECDLKFCAACERAGLCDSACGYCTTITVLGIEPFVLVGLAAAAAAVVWIAIASVVSLSFGLARARSTFRSKLPPLRADVWRLRSRDLWVHLFCHTLYVPVVLALLRAADCRGMDTTEEAVIDIGAFEPLGGSGSGGAESLEEVESSAAAEVSVQVRSWLALDWGSEHHWPHAGDIQCWSGRHTAWVVPSMVLLLVYQLFSGVLPVLIDQPVPYGGITLAVPYTFDSVSRVIKTVMLLVATFSPASPSGSGIGAHLTVTCSAVVGNLLLAAVTVLWPPSEHATIRRLRLVIYVTASWVSATALLSVLVCSQEQQHLPDLEQSSAGSSAAGRVNVDYHSCLPSNTALGVGLLVSAATSYHFLEAVTGLAPFARVALGASRANAT